MGTTVPIRESARLAAVRRFYASARNPDPTLDALTELTKRVFGVNWAAVTFVGKDKIFLVSCQGMDCTETGRANGFCAATILSDEVLVVSDAFADERFGGYELVCRMPGIRFYAGAPMQTSDGLRLGAFCIMSREPRLDLSLEQRALLRTFATAAMTHLESSSRPVRTKASITRFGQEDGGSAHAARKMAAVSRLAGGVAHGFNNLLTVITGYSQMLRSGLAPDDPLHGYAHEVFKASQRAAALTNKLLTFSSRSLSNLQTIDVNLLLARAEERLRLGLGPTMNLMLVRDPDVPRVLCDSGQLQRVVRLLVANAREAMGETGALTIRTEAAEFKTRQVGQLAGLKPGRYAVLSVEDTGPGMDEEVKSHLFEPFFTTKGVGRGTGLATVYGLVKQWGGEVKIVSAPGAGTVVSIYLPAAA